MHRVTRTLPTCRHRQHHLQQRRTVVEDATGLTGIFDADLEWSPDQAAPDKPSIFTAVQAQLALKLEPTNGPDVIAIDDVGKPAEH